MKRKLFNFAALVSLLLCLSTVVLWVRSNFRTDGISYETATRLFSAQSYPNQLLIGSREGDLKYLLRNRADFKKVSDNPRYQEYVKTHPDEVDISRILYLQNESRIEAWRPWRHYTAVRSTRQYVRHHSPFWFYLLHEHPSSTDVLSGGLWFLIPYWAVTLVTAALPGLTIYKLLRRRNRFLLNRCANCSYDLTGNTSGTCPECGTAVAGKAGT